MTVQTSLFGEPPTRKQIEERQGKAAYMKWLIEALPYRRAGNPYQRHLAALNTFRIPELLNELGGLAGEW